MFSILKFILNKTGTIV